MGSDPGVDTAHLVGDRVASAEADMVPVADTLEVALLDRDMLAVAGILAGVEARTLLGFDSFPWDCPFVPQDR